MRALIIEDHGLVAAQIEGDLIELGFTAIDIVDNEEDAVRAADLNSPDAIVSDQRLLSGSGVSAIRRICHDRKLPVVFITGFPDEVRAAMPNAIIALKPFCGTAVRTSLERAGVRFPQTAADATST